MIFIILLFFLFQCARLVETSLCRTCRAAVKRVASDLGGIPLTYLRRNFSTLKNYEKPPVEVNRGICENFVGGACGAAETLRGLIFRGARS